MENSQNTKRYDLEDRTLRFAMEVKGYLKGIQKTLSNIEYCKQLIRSSGSVGANYIEANEALSKKDFSMRIKIRRKEIKESRYWLRLVDNVETEDKEKVKLIKESEELMKIFGAIIEKTK